MSSTITKITPVATEREKNDTQSRDAEKQPQIASSKAYVSDERNWDRRVNGWFCFGMRLAVTAVMHPYEYAKVLMQIGYQPIHGPSMISSLGRRTVAMPNIFQYVQHIRTTDGWIGCYRGLTPKVVGTLTGMLCSITLTDAIGLEEPKSKLPSDLLSHKQFGYAMTRDIILSAVGVCASQPFYVISLRMMAQFVGRESWYNTLRSAFWEIYVHEGVIGFFVGLVPRLFYDLGCVVLSGTLAYVMNRYVIRNRLGQHYNAAFLQIIFSILLYPMQVVAVCMSVNGSRLAAGLPPLMPKYRNWIDCARDILQHGEWQRGVKLFWRTLPKTQQKMHLSLPNFARL